MDFKTVVEKRRSIRKFAPDAIPPECLKEMVRIAGQAPSVANSQPWRFVAVTDKNLLKAMAEEVRKKTDQIIPHDSPVRTKVEWFSTFFVDAPAVIVVLKSPYKAMIDESLPHDEVNAMRGFPDIQSIGAAIQNLLLAAVDMGFGACWLSGALIAKDELESLLDIDEPWSIAAMVAVGKPATEPEAKPKKALEEIFELR